MPGKLKSEKRLADRIMACGVLVGLLDIEHRDVEADRVDDTTGGDVSHSSEFKLPACRTVAILDCLAHWVSCFRFTLCSVFSLLI
jgi:hypothetical protein